MFFSTILNGFNTTINEKLPNVHKDETYVPATEYELHRDEELIQMEHENHILRVQMCNVCKENHMNQVKSEKQLKKEYICTKCKALNRKTYYTDNNLNPIWYERIPNATKFDQFLLDSRGNKIIRFDIPEELSELTISEQLLIRKVAPFIPAVHINSGFFALKGQCVAFPQDISDVCDTLPRKQSDLVTYIRQMGNKNTSAVKLKHLRVRRKKLSMH